MNVPNNVNHISEPRVLSPRARLSPKQASFKLSRCHSYPHREISAYNERDLQDHVPLPTAQGSDLALLDISDHYSFNNTGTPHLTFRDVCIHRNT